MAAYTTGGRHPAEPAEQRERYPDRVHGGEDDVRAIEGARGGQHPGEVARVAAAERHGAVEETRFGAHPSTRLVPSLEVVIDREPRRPELVEPVQAVARRIADRSAQRVPAEPGVAEEDEDARCASRRARLDHVG